MGEKTLKSFLYSSTQISRRERGGKWAVRQDSVRRLRIVFIVVQIAFKGVCFVCAIDAKHFDEVDWLPTDLIIREKYYEHGRRSLRQTVSCIYIYIRIFPTGTERSGRAVNGSRRTRSKATD